MLQEKCEEKIPDKVEDSARRSFLKKAAYTAPALIVMGELVRPKSALANFGGPPSDPGAVPAWQKQDIMNGGKK